MYLSRVEIDSQNRRKIKDLTHVGAYHNWVERSFPEEQVEGVRSRKLWRIDSIRGKLYLLLVSTQKPDLTSLERYGVEDSAETKDYEPFLAHLREGQRFSFRVTLNPAIALSEGEGKRGRVVPHVTVSQQTQFFLNRTEKNGFYVDEKECQLVERGFSLLKHRGEKTIRLSRATFEGRLTIVDLETFKKTLTKGIGKKKAYGFGLLTIIPETPLAL